jgi:hypothetical protein
MVGAATTYISEVVQSPDASVPAWLIYLTPLLLVGLGMAKDLIRDVLDRDKPAAPVTPPADEQSG